MILKYLVKYFKPKDAARNEQLPFKLDPNGLHTQLAWQPTLQAEGRTVYDLFNEIIDRRRLFSWRVYVAANNDIMIHVFNFLVNPLALPGLGVNIAPNANQVSLQTFDQEESIRRAIQVTDVQVKYPQVITRGERERSCFTISYSDTLEPDWTLADEAAYLASSTSSHGCVTIKRARTQQAHRAARRVERHRRAFRYFRVPKAWDGEINTNEVSPFNELWRAGLRFEPLLPLLESHDYTVNPSTNTVPDGKKADYRRPFGVVESAEGRYYEFDKLPFASGAGTEPESRGRDWSLGLQMQDDDLGVIVNVVGRPQHVIVPSGFVPADAADIADFKVDDVGIDWRNFQLTVAIKTDVFAEMQWPTTLPPNHPGDVSEPKIISVPGARLDYLVPGTDVGISDANALQTGGGHYIRDDRDRLEDLARIAYDWYSVPRTSVQVNYHDLDRTHEVGELITSIGQFPNRDTINSVITEITLNFIDGGTTIKTEFVELDVNAL